MSRPKKSQPLSDEQMRRMRSTMARTHEMIDRAMAGKNFSSKEEMQRFLDGLIRGDIKAPPPGTPQQKAQDLVYDAWDAPDLARQVELARQALALWPDCADAYVILAEHAKSPGEARPLLEQAVQAGERALGPKMFKDEVGNFWGIHSTRPYMRARQALAEVLWYDDERPAAVAHVQEMLRLNPNDNQGLRFTLAGWLAQLKDREALSSLLDAYPEDPMATLAYARALLHFWQEGDSEKARKSLHQAIKANRFVPAYLLTAKELPRQLPEAMTIGGESEAIEAAHDLLPAWLEDAGATGWLVKFMSENYPRELARHVARLDRRRAPQLPSSLTAWSEGQALPRTGRKYPVAEPPVRRPMSESAPTDEEWRRLYAAADKFGALEPWTWVYDTDVFGVMNPETREIGYCCVMGNLGQVRALAVYNGSEGLLSYLKLLKTGVTKRMDPAAMFGQDCLMASFGDQDELEAKDEAVMLALGRTQDKERWTPTFRSYRPGFVPWFINTDEARFLIHALEQATEVTVRYKGKSTELGPTKESAYLVRIPDRKPDGLTWRDEWLVPADPVFPEPRRLPVNEVRLAKVRRNCPGKSGAWEADFRYFPSPIQEKRGARPYFPYAYVVVHHETGFILASHVGPPDTSSVDLPEQFFNACDQLHMLPAELQVQSDEAAEILKPLTSALGIELKRVKRLVEAGKFYAELEKDIERGEKT